MTGWREDERERRKKKGGRQQRERRIQMEDDNRKQRREKGYDIRGKQRLASGVKDYSGGEEKGCFTSVPN